jgi:hypothetical protein
MSMPASSTVHDDDKLVTLASFASPTEAALAKSRLEMEGIRAFLDNEFLVAAHGLLSNATGGVKVKVAASDAARARQVLETRHELDEEDRDEADGYAEETYRCPKCHKKDVDLVPLHPVVLLFSIVLLGMPLMFLPRKKECRGCRHRW